MILPFFIADSRSSNPADLIAFATMSDVSASSNSIWEKIDLSALEARLNQLGDSPTTDPEPEQDHADCQLSKFLADESQERLESQSTQFDQHRRRTDTSVQYVRIPFETGQSRAVVHLAFCPDLVAVPSVNVHFVEAAGRVRITHTTCFGVRIEILLSERLDEPKTICIEAICVASESN